MIKSLNNIHLAWYAVGIVALIVLMNVIPDVEGQAVGSLTYHTGGVAVALPTPEFTLAQDSNTLNLIASIDDYYPGHIYRLSCVGMPGVFFNELPIQPAAVSLTDTGTRAPYVHTGSNFYLNPPDANSPSKLESRITANYFGSGPVNGARESWDVDFSSVLYQQSIFPVWQRDYSYSHGSHQQTSGATKEPGSASARVMFNPGMGDSGDGHDGVLVELDSVPIQRGSFNVSLLNIDNGEVSNTLRVYASNSISIPRAVLLSSQSLSWGNGDQATLSINLAETIFDSYDYLFYEVTGSDSFNASVMSYFMGGIPGSQPDVFTTNYLGGVNLSTNLMVNGSAVNNVRAIEPEFVREYAPNFSRYSNLGDTQFNALLAAGNSTVDYPLVIGVTGHQSIYPNGTGSSLIAGPHNQGMTLFLKDELSGSVGLSGSPFINTYFGPEVDSYRFINDEIQFTSSFLGTHSSTGGGDAHGINRPIASFYSPIFNLDTGSPSIGRDKILIPNYYLNQPGLSLLDCSMMVSSGLSRSVESESVTAGIIPPSGFTFQYPVTDITTSLDLNSNAPQPPPSPGSQPGSNPNDPMNPGNENPTGRAPLPPIPSADLSSIERPGQIRIDHELIRTNSTLSMKVHNDVDDDLYSCLFHSSHLLRDLNYTKSVSGNFTYYNSTVAESDIIDIRCILFADNEFDETFATRSTAYVPFYATLIASITTDDDFGWNNDSGINIFGMSIIGVLSIIVAMVGFNRANLPVSAIVFVCIYFGIAWLGIITIPETLVGIIIVFVILIIFQRGHH